MTKIFISLILLLIVSTAFAQYTICDCCSASLTYKTEKEDSLFNPALIRQNNIHGLTIRTTSKKLIIKAKDTTLNIVDKEYNEYIFKFNKAGYIDRKIWFNRLGQYHSVYEYTRDANNKITKVVFHYLDSLGNISKDFDMPETTDYSYTNGYLSKTKERDNDQKVQPDQKSSYQTFEYDTKGRQIKKYSYRYYDFAEPFSYTTNIRYNDTTKTITSKTTDISNKLFTTAQIKCDKNWNILNSKLYDKSNKLLQDNNYLYNSNDQLTSVIIRSFPGMGTECPDGGNFTNIYSYNQLGLLDNIRHQYKTTECTMRFIYK
jgi:hypothetical protein